MEIQTPFRANYEIESPDELPASGIGVLYFPPVRSGEGRVYETRIKFAYLGQGPWFGVFATRFKEGLSLATTMPAPECCCVSSVGTGYLVNVARPEEWHPIPVDPILRATVVSERQLLLLNDFTRIVAYGGEGQSWIARDLCSDELKVEAVTGDVVECIGWDAGTGDKISFAIDLLSGRRKG